MRLAIQNPSFLFQPSHALYGYGVELLKLARPEIYLTHPMQTWRYMKRFHDLGLNHLSFQFHYTSRSLNRHADVLLSLNGHLHEADNCPIKAFSGLKIAHIGEFYRHPTQVRHNLIDRGVDYLLGHGDHAKYSPLFCEQYEAFGDRLLSVPIGFSSRFHKRRAFDSRHPKCLLIGQTAGYVCDPNDKEGCKEYYDHYSCEQVCFPWLTYLRQACRDRRDLIELHVQEDLFNAASSVDSCQKLNDYMLFAAEGGLLGYACARIFEGVASGAILIAPEHGCLLDLGFENGKNCLLHPPGEREEFIRCLEQSLGSVSEIAKIADRATHWVHATYSHEVIASWLLESLEELASCSSTLELPGSSSALVEGKLS